MSSKNCCQYTLPALLLACAMTGAALGQPCEPSWQTFPLGMRANGSVAAMCVFDDGQGGGPALYIGGTFDHVDGVAATAIARWRNSTWEPVGGTFSASNGPPRVKALTVFDSDGAGPNRAVLVAAGEFDRIGELPVPSIAQWDGVAWAAMGSTGPSAPEALAVFDEDGDGPAPPRLFSGGMWGQAGSFLSRWDGTTWSPFGAVMGGGVFSLVVADLGSGAALYAGGTFSTAGGLPTSRVARWSGTQWSALGTGPNGIVMAMAGFDPDGPGPSAPVLCVVGQFSTAGGQPASNIARWNGQTWSGMGTGLAGYAQCLTLFDPDGPGPEMAALHVGGAFISSGGNTLNGVARWTGTQWAPLGQGLAGDDVRYASAITAVETPSGPRLFVGGTFESAGGVPSIGLAKWDGASWSTSGSGVSGGAPAMVRATTVLDEDGPGPAMPALYVGGDFRRAEQTPANRVARWNGENWSSLGAGLDGPVFSLGTYDDDGPGPHPARVYAGGEFEGSGPVYTSRLAVWDGSSWNKVGAPNGDAGLYSPAGGYALVRALATFDDDGSGPRREALYATGRFTNAGPLSVAGIARWDGTSWTALGAGLGTNADGEALAVYDEDGDGPGRPVLFVGGSISIAVAGGTATNLARWNGAAWSAIPGTTMNGIPLTMVVWDEDGAGPLRPMLYVGGTFTQIAGLRTYGVARWNGVNWSSVGPGLTANPLAGTIYSLAVHDDDGPGANVPALYAGGLFTRVGIADADMRFVGRWNGCTWAPLGTPSLNSIATALASFDPDADGPQRARLIVGGGFTTAGSQLSTSVAAWTGCTPMCRADWDHSCSVRPDDVSAFVLAWAASMSNGDLTGDFDANGVVGPSDVAAFVTTWLASVSYGC